MDITDLNLFVGASNEIYYGTPSPAVGPDLTLNIYDAAQANVLFTKTSTTVSGSSLSLILVDSEPNMTVGDYPYEVTSGGQIIRQGTCHIIAYQVLTPPIIQ